MENYATHNHLLTPASNMETCGGKAAGLEMLKELGMNVPSFFVVPSTEQDVAALIYNEGLKSDDLWAVRSSANVEDGESASYAGQFDTLLAIPTHELPNAIASIRTSIGQNEGLMTYSQLNGVDLDSIELHVVVQEFIEADTSGVWMGDGHGGGIIEWVNGRGSSLVDGSVTPKRISYTGGDISAPDLIDGAGISVAISCVKIENNAGVPLDIEFCIKDKKVYWLQARPTTVDMSPYVSESLDQIISGRIASKGIAKAIALRYDRHPNEWQPSSILVANNTEPKDMHAIMTSSGIITKEGGILSHAAVVSRELGIPCMVGADIDSMPHRSLVELDADSGNISIYVDGSETG